MIKNWIILGDKAFEGADSTMGKIELTKEQQCDWQNIVMNQLNASIQKSSKVREMIDSSNVIKIDFYFFEKPKITVLDVAEFIKSLEERFKDKKIDYNVSYNREFSSVLIDFWKVDFDSEDDSPLTEEQVQMKRYANLILHCRTGNVYKIKEPVFFPRFFKTLAFYLSEPIMFVSHSIATTSMMKSLMNVCSQEEFAALVEMPIFFDDTPDLDFYVMVKRILPVMAENHIRWLIIKTSDRFVEMNNDELKRLAKAFDLKIITLSM